MKYNKPSGYQSAGLGAKPKKKIKQGKTDKKITSKDKKRTVKDQKKDDGLA